MTDFSILIQNPELAKSVRFEITGSDILALAGTLVKATREATLIETRKGETYVTMEEAAEQVRRDKTTLHRWHKRGVLKHNELGLYKQSEITKLLNK